MWYNITNESDIYTPAILVYPDRIEENISRMIAIAGNVSRLRPHVKSHKLEEVVRLQVKHNIKKFKCSTLTEVKMVAENGGEDILLSYPLFGPGIKQFFDFMAKFPKVKFAISVDAYHACQELDIEAKKRRQKLNVFIDLDNGMHRTGIDPKSAIGLIDFIIENKWLHLSGFHIYDGHIHELDIKARKTHCDKDFEGVSQLIQEMEKKGIEIEELACGGTYTFSIHAMHESRTLCPGTPILWDAGYEQNIPELDFLHAAVLVSRVISKPDSYLCFDIGYKSLASEMPHPRLRFLKLKVKEVVNHSEEHLVVSISNPDDLELGDIAYALPHHVCPTIALHEKVYVVHENKVINTWKVVARKRLY